MDNEYRPSRQMEEIASWRLASEMVRRYPNKLSIIETHPGGGQYDCLTLISEVDGITIHVNRGGSITIFSEDDRELAVPWSQSWSQNLIAADDLKRPLDQLCEIIG